MGIDPRVLSLVLAIAEHGTFNRAAKALGISQPALSKKISLIERRLGAKLFERGARGSTLTEAGTVIVRSAHNLHNILERARKDIAAEPARPTGALVVGATPSMMLGLVPEALTRLAKQQQHLRITIVEGLDDQLTPALARGELDLLIGPLEPLHAAPDGLTQEKLADESFGVGLAPGHRLAGHKKLRLADLHEEPWILPTPGSSFHRTVEAMFMTAGLPWPSNFIQTNSLHTHEQLVLTTGRVALLTSAELVSRRTDIRVVSLEGAPVRTIGVRRQAGMLLPPLADRLLACLRILATKLR